jgi:hypothetical protein
MYLVCELLREAEEKKMIEVLQVEFGRHDDHDYIEGLFYNQIENLTRGRLR